MESNYLERVMGQFRDDYTKTQRQAMADERLGIKPTKPSPMLTAWYYVGGVFKTVIVMLLFCLCIVLVPFDALYKWAVARLHGMGWL